MDKEIIVKYLIIGIVVLIYLIYTLQFSLQFRKNIVFKGWIKVFHYFMFWLVPFAWVLLIKNISKSSKKSYEVENKSEPIPFSDPYTGP